MTDSLEQKKNLNCTFPNDNKFNSIAIMRNYKNIQLSIKSSALENQQQLQIQVPLKKNPSERLSAFPRTCTHYMAIYIQLKTQRKLVKSWKGKVGAYKHCCKTSLHHSLPSERKEEIYGDRLFIYIIILQYDESQSPPSPSLTRHCFHLYHQHFTPY